VRLRREVLETLPVRRALEAAYLLVIQGITTSPTESEVHDYIEVAMRVNRIHQEIMA